MNHPLLWLPNEKWARELLDMDRVVGAISGHCCLNKHLARMGLSNDSNCTLGLEEGTGIYMYVNAWSTLSSGKVLGRQRRFAWFTWWMGEGTKDQQICVPLSRNRPYHTDKFNVRLICLVLDFWLTFLVNYDLPTHKITLF